MTRGRYMSMADMAEGAAIADRALAILSPPPRPGQFSLDQYVDDLVAGHDRPGIVREDDEARRIAQAEAIAARMRAEKVEIARRAAEKALSRAKDASASLSAFRWSVEQAQAKLERAAWEAHVMCDSLAGLEASPEVERACAALAIDAGAPEAQVQAILKLPETIRPSEGA